MMPSKEKVARFAKDGIPLPAYLGELVFYFKDHVRSALIKNDKVESLWLNGKGNPVGK
jgi:hypothetical protein